MGRELVGVVPQGQGSVLCPVQCCSLILLMKLKSIGYPQPCA